MHKILTLSLLLFISGLSAGDLKLPKSFVSSFSQVITNPKGSKIKYKGTLNFSDKVFLKWEYKTPTKKEVCLNGKVITIVDHDLEQISKYKDPGNFNLSQVVSNAKRRTKTIYTTKVDEKLYTILIDSSKRIRSIAYFDNMDNKVQVTFNKIKYTNKPLLNKDLICSEPKIYDNIR